MRGAEMYIVCKDRARQAARLLCNVFCRLRTAIMYNYCLESFPFGFIGVHSKYPQYSRAYIKTNPSRDRRAPSPAHMYSIVMHGLLLHPDPYFQKYVGISRVSSGKGPKVLDSEPTQRVSALCRVYVLGVHDSDSALNTKRPPHPWNSTRIQYSVPIDSIGMI